MVGEELMSSLLALESSADFVAIGYCHQEEGTCHIVRRGPDSRWELVPWEGGHPSSSSHR